MSGQLHSSAVLPLENGPRYPYYCSVSLTTGQGTVIMGFPSRYQFAEFYYEELRRNPPWIRELIVREFACLL